MNLTEEEIGQLNDFAGFLGFEKTWPFEKFCNARSRIVCQFTGNQFGKTSGTAHTYVQRVLGIFPVPEKNVVYLECENISGHDDYPVDGCHLKQRVRNKHTGDEKDVWLRSTWRMADAPKDMKCPRCGGKVKIHPRKSRTFRFCAEVLPGQSATVGDSGESAEVKNTQYPAFKKWLPNFLIKKDITARNTSLIVKDIWGGEDIIIDFVGYNQSIQSTAGTQRLSIWYDEEPPQEFRNEQVPRLLQENGDEIFTVTPANHITWMYDELFECARVIYRTKHIVDFLRTESNETIPQIEWTSGQKDITVIMAATDDNPTLGREAIQAMVDSFDDPDVIAIRRYGIFKQVSGRIFKDYDWRIHELDPEKWFPKGIPFEWVHARGIDYHPQTPWGFGVMSISPDDEAFIWLDANPSPEKLTTSEICEALNSGCGDYQFRFNLIDPLSETIKKDHISTLDDINEKFFRLRQEGSGPGGYWTTWDTRGQHGRDEIRKRLKNSLKCKTPFNNVQDGERLPTIWLFSNCRHMCKSFKSWRWEEYKDAGMTVQKGEKNKAEQRWSHHPMCVEAIFKTPGFRASPVRRPTESDRRPRPFKKRFKRR